MMKQFYRFHGALYREAAKLQMYHGTAAGADNEILRKILKEGLQANPKERRYVPPEQLDEQDVMQVRDVEYVTYGGVYLASDLVGAFHYAQGARQQIGGDLVIVVAQIETRSPEVTIDEDQFLSTVNIRLFNKTFTRATEQATGNSMAFGPDVYRAVQEGLVDLRDHVEPFLRDLTKRKPLAVPVERLLRYQDEFAALLLLAFEFEAATGYRAEEPHRDPTEIAADFRSGANELYRRISGLADPVPGRNVRSFDTITYRGANRILAVLVLRPSESRGWIAYSGDDTVARSTAQQLNTVLGDQLDWGFTTPQQYDSVADDAGTAMEIALERLGDNDPPDCDSYDVDEELCREAEDEWRGYVDQHGAEQLEDARSELYQRVLQLQRDVEQCGGEDALEYLQDNWEELLYSWPDEDDPTGCVDPEEVHGIVDEAAYNAEVALFGNLLEELTQERAASVQRTAITEQQQRQLFSQLAEQQRGRAEAAMVQARRPLGGTGVYPYALEHVGDLIHRMAAYAFRGESYGHDAVWGKTRTCLRDLKRYDFEQKFQDAVSYIAEETSVPRETALQEAKAALQEYAAAHAELPTYNDAQALARCAAVQLGRRDFEGAEACLQELWDKLDIYDEQEWVDYIRRYEG